MFKKYYPVKFFPYIYYLIIWAAWIGVWIWVPPEELVWGPIKWIFVAIFAPIGLILLGALFGYRVEFTEDKLTIGFFPFIRKIKIADLKDIRKGAVYPRSMWKTSEFVTLVPKQGKPISFPCNGAEEIIKILKPFIEKYQ